MSHHYSGPDFGFPRGDARLDFTDLYAFPKPGEADKSILIMNCDNEPRSNRVRGRRVPPITGIGEQHLPTRQACPCRTYCATAVNILIRQDEEGE